jgi:hypothetical protein
MGISFRRALDSRSIAFIAPVTLASRKMAKAELFGVLFARQGSRSESGTPRCPTGHDEGRLRTYRARSRSVAAASCIHVCRRQQAFMTRLSRRPEFTREPANCIGPKWIDSDRAYFATTASRTIEGEFLIPDRTRRRSGQFHRMLAFLAERPMDGSKLFESISST